MNTIFDLPCLLAHPMGFVRRDSDSLTLLRPRIPPLPTGAAPSAEPVQI